MLLSVDKQFYYDRKSGYMYEIMNDLIQVDFILIATCE
jgi:hypothetical protein